MPVKTVEPALTLWKEESATVRLGLAEHRAKSMTTSNVIELQMTFLVIMPTAAGLLFS